MALKGLVTFSLFGSDPMYTVGALKNIEIWRNSPLDVDCIFFVGPSVDHSVIRQLKEKTAYIQLVRDLPEDYTATFWRWDAFRLAENRYDYVLSRDVDSRPFEREYIAIEQWLASKMSVHVIRDHPYHGVPMLAGLFGVRSWMFGWFADRLPLVPPDDFYQWINAKYKRDYDSNDFYQVDQHWLRKNVYPHLRNQIFAHDSFYGFERKRYRHFLPFEEGYRFCGEGFNEYDEPRYPAHRELIPMWPRR